jgi:hypothetical protein
MLRQHMGKYGSDISQAAASSVCDIKSHNVHENIKGVLMLHLSKGNGPVAKLLRLYRDSFLPAPDDNYDVRHIHGYTKFKELHDRASAYVASVDVHGHQLWSADRHDVQRQPCSDVPSQLPSTRPLHARRVCHGWNDLYGALCSLTF